MNLFFKTLLKAFFMVLIITSCDKNESVDSPLAQNNVIKKRLFSVAKTITSNSSITPSTVDEDYAEECISSFNCFEYVFPITMVNGTNETVVNNEDQLYDFYEALDDNAEPEMSFPITIKFDDNTEEVINNIEALDAAYISCFGEVEPCFTIKFPITIIAETDNLSNQTEVNSETELHSFIEEAYTKDDNVVITFSYPITVTLNNGTEVSIENDNEFDEIYSNCYDFEDFESFEDFNCFDLQFPIKAIKSGEEISLNSFDDIEDYLEGLDEEGEAEFVFPINIIYIDGTQITVDSLEDLEIAFDECFYSDYEDDICFDITYPINLIKNDNETNISTVNNDQEFDTFLNDLQDEDFFDIVYPLTVILEDGTTKVIDTDEDFIDLFDSCDIES